MQVCTKFKEIKILILCVGNSQNFKVSQKVNFGTACEGLFCHNHLYMAALLIPIIGIIPALILDFTLIVLGILIQCVVNDLPVMGKSSTFMIFYVILP